MRARVLVTSVGAPPGTNTLRALKRVPDIEVIAADVDPHTASLYLYADRAVRLPPARDEDVYVETLVKLVKEIGIDIIIPCLEPEVAAVARHQETLAATGVRFLVPSFAVLDKVVSKCSLMRQAVALGIPAPKTWLLTSDFRREDYGLELPLVVKPDRGYGMRGVRVVRTDSEWEALLGSELEDGGWIVQEFIPGQVGSVHMFGVLCDERSRLLGTFLSRSLRTQFPDGGPATVGEPVRNTDISAFGRRLAEAVGWVGPAGIEFKVHGETGRPFLLEINPRMWGYSWLATECGINLSSMLVDHLLGRPVEERHDYPLDRVFIRGYQDIVIDRSLLA